MFWDFGSAVSLQRQATGDHVQKSSTRELQQQKQLQDPQQQSRASGYCSKYQRGCCSTSPRIVTHCPNPPGKCRQEEYTRAPRRKRHHSQHPTCPLHGTRGKPLQNIMNYDDDICKNLLVGAKDLRETAQSQPKLRGECLIARRLHTVALLPTCFLCLQTCHTHVTILPTHSRWLKACQKTELHLTLCVCVFVSSVCLGVSLSLFLSLSLPRSVSPSLCLSRCETCMLSSLAASP